MFTELETNDTEDYRGFVGVAQSDLKKCWENPQLYHQIYVERSRPRPKSTAAQIWGTQCERYLRGEPISELVIPDEVLTSNGQRRGKKWDRWAEANPGHERAIKSDEEFERCQEFAQVLLNIERHEMARSILDGRIIWSLRCHWDNEPWPLTFKAELDIVDYDRKFVCDVKTTRNPSPDSFRRDLFKFGYDVQAAQYLMAMQNAGRAVFDEWDYLWLIIRNHAPYDVEVYRASPALINYGSRRRNEMIEHYIKCATSDQWLSRTHGRVIEIDLPSYLNNDRSFEL